MIWSLTSHIILKIMKKIYFHLKVFVQSFSHVRLFEIPWTAVSQASLSITNSRGSPKPMSIESVMPSNHLIFCYPLLLLPSIFASIRVFSNESAFHIRWPKYWSICLGFKSHQDMDPSYNYGIWKDPDAGKDWRQEEKGMTEDEMVGWHHRLYGQTWVWVSSGSWWWTG